MGPGGTKPCDTRLTCERTVDSVADSAVLDDGHCEARWRANPERTGMQNWKPKKEKATAN